MHTQVLNQYTDVATDHVELINPHSVNTAPFSSHDLKEGTDEHEHYKCMHI